MRSRKKGEQYPEPVQTYSNVLVENHSVGSPPRNQVFPNAAAVADYLRWNDRATREGLAENYQCGQRSYARAPSELIG